MPSQSSFINGGIKELKFDEIAISEGDLHTIQTGSVKGWTNLAQAGENTDYELTVELVKCIHGRLEKSKDEAASLIVIEYRLRNKTSPFHYASFHTEFTFDAESPKGANPDHPVILQWAPFRDNERFEVVEVQVDKEKYAKITGGAEFPPGKAEAEAGASKKEAFVKGYYIRCQSNTRFNKSKGNVNDHVWWQMNENAKTTNGVPATIRIAMLVERGPKSKARFVGRFKSELAAGPGYAMHQFWKWLKRDKEIEDPITFDPKEPAVGGEGIDADNLGKYKDKKELQDLTIVLPN